MIQWCNGVRRYCKSLTFYSIEPPRLPVVYRKTLVKYTRYINAVFNLLKNICKFAPHNLKNRISKSELCESHNRRKEIEKTRGKIMIKNQSIFRTNIYIYSGATKRTHNINSIFLSSFFNTLPLANSSYNLS